MICVIDGCEKKLRSDNKSGYCRRHYNSFNVLRWQRENPEKVNAKARRNSNKEKATAKMRKWRADNPDKASEANHRRRTSQKNVFVDDVEKSELWYRDSGLCFLCSMPAEKDDWHLGHVIPLARGGEHSYANTAVYHPYCNLYQGSKLIEELDVESFLILREEELSCLI